MNSLFKLETLSLIWKNFSVILKLSEKFKQQRELFTLRGEWENFLGEGRENFLGDGRENFLGEGRENFRIEGRIFKWKKKKKEESHFLRKERTPLSTDSLERNTFWKQKSLEEKKILFHPRKTRFQETKIRLNTNKTLLNTGFFQKAANFVEPEKNALELGRNSLLKTKERKNSSLNKWENLEKNKTKFAHSSKSSHDKKFCWIH